MVTKIIKFFKANFKIQYGRQSSNIIIQIYRIKMMDMSILQLIFMKKIRIITIEEIYHKVAMT
jgi:hypothetical protein